MDFFIVHALALKADLARMMVEPVGDPTSPRDMVSQVFISGGQSSPLELAFGVELGPNPQF